ncbi:probable E3 ubiquitin-protein ligase LUL4 isoform X2 [Cornus florida]|uniref:probable E3 ubiquitin-protein ligase LUL4 isoform X2 n=1 Tax=Cornus florida TaxID=4283 RepID=UPI0028998540|nr:probable E3 ubiquitin-protein ligase LUL4 isoform X2 [Cornus florida]
MGLSWSSRRRHNRRQNHNHQHPSLPQSNPPFSNPPPAPPTPSPPPPSYAFAANAPYHAPQNPPPQNPYPTLPSPSPPPQFHAHNYSNYARPMVGQSSYNPYYSNMSSGWTPPAGPSQLVSPPPYVDHQSTKRIKNDANVHKDTIRVESDDENPDTHLVSFIFDATVDGSITILYFAKEEANCTFTSLFPEIHKSVRIPFQKGSGQKFCQPSGTGVDLGFFSTDELSKPLPEDVFPLVISLESCLPSTAVDERPNKPLVTTNVHAQITQAVLEKNNEGHFNGKVIKQILWVDGVRYELHEIYGISNSDKATINSNDSGKECVICMTEPKDTTVLPCRHMCMCSDCAKELRLQSNKCPICREPIQKLIEIKVNDVPALP